MQKGCSKILLAKFPKCFQHQATFAKDFCTLAIGFLISNKYIYSKEQCMGAQACIQPYDS